MTPKQEVLVSVIREVRTCFNQLKTLAERLHEDLGVKPSMRAVMESLAGGGPQTVPDIARNKGVSRQHVQNIMNSLQAAGLVEGADNPAHKRSPHFDLTAKGRAIFAVIEEREAEPLRRIASSMTTKTLVHATEALHCLNQHLASEIADGESHERSQ
jgi:DNA-binding MarR family transcriptional regulator